MAHEGASLGRAPDSNQQIVEETHGSNTEGSQQDSPTGDCGEWGERGWVANRKIVHCCQRFRRHHASHVPLNTGAIPLSGTNGPGSGLQCTVQHRGRLSF